MEVSKRNNYAFQPQIICKKSMSRRAETGVPAILFLGNFNAKVVYLTVKKKHVLSRQPSR